jgi:hypothetical protein
VENKENLDQLFREGLLEPDIPFNEQDWEKMSRKLDLQTKSRTVPVWLIWASAAAAILIISMFWMFFQQSVTVKKQVQNQIAKHQQLAPENNTKNQDSQAKVQEPKLGNQGRSNTSSIAKKTTQEQPIYARNQAITDTAKLEELGSLNSGPIVLNGQQTAAAGSSASAAGSSVPFDATISTPKRMPAENYSVIVKNVKKKMKTSSRQKPDLILSAMLAPDISYAKSSIPSKVSSNAGLLATYGFTRKLSVTSGAIYSNKYYNSNVNGVNAYNTNGDTYQVNAACNVLDIPLNVNYKVLDKKKFSVSVNTGLSSYLMLKEKYDYIYPQAGSNPNIVSFQVTNQNKHILGVANMAISVERKISSNVSIGVQPFMKVPLTGIGAGNASLKSSGMSFSINVGLFPSKKPSKFASLIHY